MNRDQAEKLAPVIKHYAEGGEVQRSVENAAGETRWEDVPEPNFSPWREWRIKPGPIHFWAVVLEDGTISAPYDSEERAEMVMTAQKWKYGRVTEFCEVVRDDDDE